MSIFLSMYKVSLITGLIVKVHSGLSELILERVIEFNSFVRDFFSYKTVLELVRSKLRIKWVTQ